QAPEQPLDGRSVGDVEPEQSIRVALLLHPGCRQVCEHQLVPRTRRGPPDVVAQHPRRACHEEPHRIDMSELSPTMKRYARGWLSPRRTVTLRPSSEDSMRPSSCDTTQPASRIECSTSEPLSTQRSPIAVYGPT